MNKRIKCLKHKKNVAPSIFAADFLNIEKALNVYEKANIDMIHYDVMDNNFVPNISFGPKFIEDISKNTKIPADVHLMIDLDSSRNIEDYLKLNISNITIHFEATKKYLMDYINLIKNSGKTVGLSIRPYTPVEVLVPYFDKIDLILLMSVEPGFSGQKFIKESLQRIARLKNLLSNDYNDIVIEIDGGIGRKNYIEVFNEGVDLAVIGSAFLSDKDPCEWVNTIHNL